MKNLPVVSLLIGLVSVSGAFASEVTVHTTEGSVETKSMNPETDPLVWIGFNALPIGAGAAAGAAVIPLEAGIHVVGGLSIGPTATFSGSFTQDQAQYSLSGFGVQAMYNFGRTAISDGFYVQGFFNHYTLSASKMTDVGSQFGIPMQVPLEGSIPINSFGGGIGYQWVWHNGLRLAAGVQVAYYKTDATGINLMGMGADEINSVSQMVNIPVIQDQSAIIPMPELSLGLSI